MHFNASDNRLAPEGFTYLSTFRESDLLKLYFDQSKRPDLNRSVTDIVNAPLKLLRVRKLPFPRWALRYR